VFKQTGVAASRFQTGHLGGADVEGVWPPSERAGTPTQLMVGFQQGDSDPVMGKKSCGRETGNAAADHNHILAGVHPRQPPSGDFDRVMLAAATDQRGCGMSWSRP